MTSTTNGSAHPTGPEYPPQKEDAFSTWPEYTGRQLPQSHHLPTPTPPSSHFPSPPSASFPAPPGIFALNRFNSQSKPSETPAPRHRQGYIRVLSVDGGGIRGIIPLHIMEQIELKVHERRTAKATAQHLPPPKKLQIVDMFDVISGTSTGGIIALALTECGMTVSEVKTFYMQKVSGLFNGSSLHKMWDTIYHGAKYHSEPIEALMKSVANKPANAKLSKWVNPSSPWTQGHTHLHSDHLPHLYLLCLPSNMVGCVGVVSMSVGLCGDV